jgi:hypothetical protein
MQGHFSSHHGQRLDETQATIPAIVVDCLRSAAYAEIGLAAEALDTVAFANDREAHPEWFRGPAENLREIYALLDAIGWSRTVPPADAQIDLREGYCWALMRALQGAAEFADDDESGEAACSDVEQTEQALALAQDPEAERVGALWGFIADARAQIDELAVEEGDGEGFVLDIAA